MSELPPHLQTLVDNARRAHDPSSADRERVYRALSLTLATTAGGAAALTASHAGALSNTGSLTPVAAKTGLGLGLKSTLAIAIAVAGVGLWATLPSAEPKAPVAGRVAQAATAASAAEVAFGSGLGNGTHDEARVASRSSRAATAGEHVPAENPGPAETASSASLALTARDARDTREAVSPSQLSDAPVIKNAATPSERVASAGRVSETTRRSQVSRARADARKTLGAEAQLTRTQQELELVRAALTALRDAEPARAMQFLESHAQQFPHGSMVRERLGLRVVSLCALGQGESGRKEQAAFLKLDSSSPLAKRVRAACGGDVP